MLVTLFVVFEILGILSAVHAVMATRTPQGAIAWAVSLVAVPYVAVPAYWIFGRNKFQGYVRAHSEDLRELESFQKLARDYASNVVAADGQASGTISAAEILARVPITEGNEVELLVDGQATFDSIFEGIAAAKDYVLVQFYIVRDDELGRKLKTRIIEKAQQGVAVYFMYDEVGSLGLPASYVSELRDAGVNASSFHSRKGRGNRFQLNFRNHRKIVVVDGQSAWIGGHNVGDEYLGKSEEFGRWRDTHVRIDGPAVAGAQLSFAEDWHWATDQLPSHWNWNPERHGTANSQVLVISSGPADELETAGLMFTQAINAATRRIWIASPYFVPDDAVIQAIQLAGLRGVDVRILIPDRADSLLVHLSAYSYLNEVSAAGAKFYRYEGGFLHQKTALVDDRASMVGTANFDNRSFRLNFEVTAVIFDVEFAAEVEDMFEADFLNSRLMQAGEFDSKPWWFRFAVRTARLAAPIQ
jgi:cardiolipin synthase